MADALMQLSEVLRSKTDEEKVTTSEKQLVYSCLVKMVKSFFVGAVISSAAVYRATRRFGRWNGVYLSAGSSLLIGHLVSNMSGNACLEQILSLEGSRMQSELADIILRNYWKDPSRMQLVQKHFYPEVVLSDLNPDISLVWWRIRNVYGDVDVSVRMDDHGGGKADENVETQSSAESMNNMGGDFLADPLDCIFGNHERGEDIRHADCTEFTRRRRHARRRGRKHLGPHHSDAFSPSTNDRHFPLPKLWI